MVANKACKEKSDENRSSKTFFLTDEEIFQLLQVMIDYKASKTAAGLGFGPGLVQCRRFLLDFAF